MSTQLSSISPALSRLLTKSIDYAGIFPPASLPLNDGLAMFNRYLHGRESWIVSSLVLPIDLLAKAGDFSDGAPFRLSALPRRTQEPDQWLARLQEDCEQLRLFLTANSHVGLQALEISLPISGDDSDVGKQIEQLIPLVEGHRVFLELPAGDDSFLQRLATLIAAFENRRLEEWGLKLRMGGTTPDAIPAVAIVANVLAATRDHGIPIKFTAGLHHPLRHWNQEMGAAVHGFINVMMAALFAHACRLPAKNIEAILNDERSNHFVFNGDVARWLDLPIRTELIEDLRRLVVGFGSCSVEEPLEGLRTLGWWE